MPRLNGRVPAYRRHRASGQAVVTLDGRDFYLDPHGSEVSKREYDRLVLEWLTNGRRLAAAGPTPLNPSVNEILLAYWRHVEAYYVKDGQPTSEQTAIRSITRVVRHLYGSTPAREFGPLKLKAVRQMLVGSDLSRKYINEQVSRVKSMFKWAASQELISAEVYHGLCTVAGLRRGRSPAREPAPVRPVADEFVEAVSDFVPRQVWAMIQLQQLTGMRPGEVVIMRGVDIDMTDLVWPYHPRRHKLEHHQLARVIELGPRAQAVLRPFLRTDPGEPLFQPVEAEAERRSVLRLRRRTHVQPSQRDRRRVNPARAPGSAYSVDSYRRSITRACDCANRRALLEAGLTPDADRRVPRWFPHQLRHSFATNVRRTFGVEAARLALGHRHVRTTEIYAEIEHSRTAEILAQIG